MARGPGTLETQILNLRAKMSAEDVSTAQNLASNVSENVLALAYKLMRAEAKNKLPKPVEKMLDGLSEEDAAIVRGKFAQANG